MYIFIVLQNRLVCLRFGVYVWHILGYWVRVRVTGKISELVSIECHRGKQKSVLIAS
jgi:hypothetical protein